MPAEHRIDEAKKLIVTTWTGEVADGELIKALSAYQQTIKGKPEYAAFDEIVDFSKAGYFRLSVQGIQKLAQIGAVTDARGVKTKLAFVMSTPVAYSLAKMYQTYRNFISGGSKTLSVFSTYEEALNWVEGK